MKEKKKNYKQKEEEKKIKQNIFSVFIIWRMLAPNCMYCWRIVQWITHHGCSSVVVSSTNYLKLQRAMRFMCIHQYACCIYWAKLSRIKCAMNWLFRWPCVDFFFPTKLTHIPLHTGNAVVYMQKNMHTHTTSIWQSKANSVFAMWITMVSIPVHHALSRCTCFISTNNAC